MSWAQVFDRPATSILTSNSWSFMVANLLPGISPSELVLRCIRKPEVAIGGVSTELASWDDMRIEADVVVEVFVDNVVTSAEDRGVPS